MPEQYSKDTVMIIACAPCDPEKQRVLGIERMTPLPGSESHPCVVCKDFVWVGPKQLAKIKELEAQGFKGPITCFPCAIMYQQMAGIETDKMEVRSCGEESAHYEFSKDGPKF
jgi:hypothetical protein